MCVKEELLFVKLEFSRIESILCQAERKVTLIDGPSLAKKKTKKQVSAFVRTVLRFRRCLATFVVCEKKSWKSVVVQAC